MRRGPRLDRVPERSPPSRSRLACPASGVWREHAAAEGRRRQGRAAPADVGAAPGQHRRGSRCLRGRAVGRLGADRRRKDGLRPGVPGVDGGGSSGRQDGLHGRGEPCAEGRMRRGTRWAACSSGWVTRRARSTPIEPRTARARSTRSRWAPTRSSSRAPGRGSDAEQFLAGKQSQTPDSARILTYLAEVEVDRGRQPRLSAARAAGARQAARLQGGDGRHRAGLLPRPPMGPRQVRAQAILDGADDGSIPPRDKGNADALLIRALIERESGDRKHALVDFEQAAAEAARPLRGVHQPGRDEARSGQRHRGAAPPREGRRATRRTSRSRTSTSATAIACWVGPGDAKKEFDTADRHGLDAGRSALRSRPAIPVLAERARRLRPGRSTRKAIQELETYRSMRRREVRQGTGRRRRRASEHGQAQAERASAEEAGCGRSAGRGGVRHLPRVAMPGDARPSRGTPPPAGKRLRRRPRADIVRELPEMKSESIGRSR